MNRYVYSGGNGEWGFWYSTGHEHDDDDVPFEQFSIRMDWILEKFSEEFWNERVRSMGKRLKTKPPRADAGMMFCDTYHLSELGKSRADFLETPGRS